MRCLAILPETLRLALTGVVLVAALFLSPATAEPVKIVIGTSPIADVMSAFVAKEKGFFAKHGLDVSITLIPLNPTIPAALHAKSIQIGAPNAAVFIQAVDSGLDLQIVSGSTTTPNMGAGIAYLTREDVPFDGARSLEGKKIIIPGLSSSVDVLFRKWLADQGADEKKISFVEIPSAQSSDALKGRTVDGAVAVEPFLTRIQQAGTGKLAARFMDGLADEKLGISFIATREWVAQNPEAARNFAAAIAEAMDWANANQQEARNLMQPYLNLPQAVLDAIPFPHMRNKATPEAVAWWIDVMKSQGRVRSALKPAEMIMR